jgi:hypothetical protein
MQNNALNWEWESLKFNNKHIRYVKLTVAIPGSTLLDSCWSEPWYLTKKWRRRTRVVKKVTDR